MQTDPNSLTPPLLQEAWVDEAVVVARRHVDGNPGANGFMIKVQYTELLLHHELIDKISKQIPMIDLWRPWCWCDQWQETGGQEEAGRGHTQLPTMQTVIPG